MPETYGIFLNKILFENVLYLKWRYHRRMINRTTRTYVADERVKKVGKIKMRLQSYRFTWNFSWGVKATLFSRFHNLSYLLSFCRRMLSQSLLVIALHADASGGATALPNYSHNEFGPQICSLSSDYCYNFYVSIRLVRNQLLAVTHALMVSSTLDC